MKSLLAILLLLRLVDAFLVQQRSPLPFCARGVISHVAQYEQKSLIQKSKSEDSQDDADVQEGDPDEQPIIQTSTVRIDDGGSNLTDRFKYKVNALMGTYDPAGGADDERQDGNILNAMLSFPVRYTFNIVGRTSGDNTTREKYIEDVKNMVQQTAGDDNIECKITPRGNNFTKVQCEVEVLSATMINTIYDDLDKLELTVMRF